MFTYLPIFLATAVVITLWRWWIGTYNLKETRKALKSAQGRLDQAETTLLRVGTQIADHARRLASTELVVRTHGEVLNAMASRAREQPVRNEPMQSYSPEAASSARKRSAKKS